MNTAHPDPPQSGPSGHHTLPAAAIVPAATADTPQPARRPRPLVLVGAWVGWHGIELTAVAVPLAAAALWSRWLAALAAVSGTVWVVQEIRTARQHRAAVDTEGEQP